MTTTGLSNDLAKSATAKTATAPRPELRKDFREELERRLEGWLGRPGTPQRATVEGLVEGILGEPDANGLRHVDLTKLQSEKLNELARLQKASEDFEAVFVKGMLSQMRRTSMSEDTGPMGEMAKDFMDQAVAESVAQSRGSLGIAKTVFVEMAQRVVSTIDLKKAE